MAAVLVRIMTSWDGSDVPPDADGFVHLSWADQVAGSVARHYASSATLLFLVVDERALPPGTLRVEDTAGHGAHPHLHATLPAAAVLATVPWQRGDPMPHWEARRDGGAPRPRLAEPTGAASGDLAPSCPPTTTGRTG